jgi:hypothetical protein
MELLASSKNIWFSNFTITQHNTTLRIGMEKQAYDSKDSHDTS